MVSVDHVVTSRILCDTYAEFFRYKTYHVNGIFSVTKSICCKCAVHCCTNLSSDSTTPITLSGLGIEVSLCISQIMLNRMLFAHGIIPGY